MAPAILRQIRGCRYAPLDVNPGHPGLHRIERFTVRGTKGTVPGSTIPQRGTNLTIHSADLTETEAMTEAYRGRTREEAAAPIG